jgi:hypothetical protein
VSDLTHLTHNTIFEPINFSSNSELKSFYEEFGFISVKDLFPRDFISKIASDLTTCFQIALSNSKSFDENIIYLNSLDKKELWNLHNGSLKIASIRSLISIISDLIKK